MGDRRFFAADRKNPGSRSSRGFGARGDITISESHYGGTYFDTKTVTDYTYHYGQTFYGFIYTYQGSAKKKSKVCSV